jgi:hypothetical protein
VKLLTGSLCVAVLCGIAGADSNNGFSKLSPDGLPETTTWNDEERSVEHFWADCETLGSMFKTKITCSYDKKTFKTFYAAELTHPKLRDRVNANPSWLCGDNGLLHLTTSGSNITQKSMMGLCAGDDACRKDFAERVKSVSCSIVAKDALPSMKLEHGVLTLAMTRRPVDSDDSLTGSTDWTHEELIKLFPRYKKLYDAHKAERD